MDIMKWIRNTDKKNISWLIVVNMKATNTQLSWGWVLGFLGNRPNENQEKKPRLYFSIIKRKIKLKSMTI
jgi:hypothetical protein